MVNQNPEICQSFRVEIHAPRKGLRSSWIGKALSVHGCKADGLVQGSAPVDFDGVAQSDSRRNLSVQLHLPSEGCRETVQKHRAVGSGAIAQKVTRERGSGLGSWRKLALRPSLRSRFERQLERKRGRLSPTARTL